MTALLTLLALVLPVSAQLRSLPAPAGVPLGYAAPDPLLHAAPEPRTLKVPEGLAGPLDLSYIDPADTGPTLRTKKQGQRALGKELAKLQKLKDRLIGQKEQAVLVVLQGLDTSGKDGVVKHVLGALNPIGLEQHSFKAPTEEEVRRGYLWRIQQRVPAKGRIGVFNRSHYEDYLVPRALKLSSKKDLEARLRQINEFERYLTENGVRVVKLFLHISKKEQLSRLRERLSEPEKVWKFDPNDLKTRKKWSRFQKAYGEMLAATSTDHAPWYVIPADKKWYRNVSAARILRATLESMDLQRPSAKGLPKPEDLK